MLFLQSNLLFILTSNDFLSSIRWAFQLISNPFRFLPYYFLCSFDHFLTKLNVFQIAFSKHISLIRQLYCFIDLLIQSRFKYIRLLLYCYFKLPYSSFPSIFIIFSVINLRTKTVIVRIIYFLVFKSSIEIVDNLFHFQLQLSQWSSISSDSISLNSWIWVTHDSYKHI